MYACVAVKPALMAVPGMLRNVPEICTSTFGMIYTP
jgi:hypothetical protein